MNELQEEVCVLVSSALGGHPGQVDGRVAEAVGNVESEAGLRKLREAVSQSGRMKPWYKRWWTLGLSCVLFFIGVWFVQSITYDPKVTRSLSTNKVLGLFGGMSWKGSTLNFTKEEKWILDGDPSEPTRWERMYGLWESDRSNKQYAAEAVFEYKREYDVFPDNLLEVGASVDPDNPWYLYMAAIDLADLAVSKTKKEQENEEDKVEWEYEVIDQEKFEEAWALIKSGGEMGRLRHHRKDLLEKRLAIYSKSGGHHVLSKVAFIAEAAGHTRGGIDYLKLSQIFIEKFKSLKAQNKSNSKEEVRECIRIMVHFLDSTLDERVFLLDILVVQACLESLLDEAQLAAEHAGLIDEAEKLGKLNEQIKEDKLAKQEMREDIKYLDHGEYGLLGGMFGSTGHIPLEKIEFDMRDYDWDRYSEHSFITKHVAIVTGILLFITLLASSSYLLYKGKLARFFGLRVLGLLNYRDWLLIISGGIILPVIIYYFINQHSSLGVRKWNVLAAGGMAVLVQFVSMLLLALTMSYTLLRWRLCEKSRGVVRNNGVLEYLSVIAILAAMLLIGCAGYKTSWVSYIAYTCLAFTVGYLFIKGLRGLINNEKIIAVSALNRGMLSLIALLLMVTIFMAPFYYADEKKWIREDPLFTLRANHLGIDSREYRTIQAMKEELKERLDMIR